MMRITTGICLVIAVTILFVDARPGIAQEVTEHPLIRPYPGAVFNSDRSEYRSFGEYDFRVGVPPRNYKALTVQGEFRRLYYYLYTQDGRPNRDVSQPEYFENFKAAAL